MIVGIRITTRGIHEYKQSLLGAKILERFLASNNAVEEVELTERVQEEIDKGNLELVKGERNG